MEQRNGPVQHIKLTDDSASIQKRRADSSKLLGDGKVHIVN
jgi:hypothetical protein